ncbi:MAG TPA: penicillin acylase family protein, partial [Gemmatimonadaceae bacterium]|nr:penicillin acylase family protein [Gemmatimonadaceae bacterium]
YKIDGQWRPLEKRVEKYVGKDGRILAIDTLYFTHRGPMRRQLGQWLSMRWTAYEKSHEPDNFMSLGEARNVADWLDRMRDYVAPTQNGLVADRGGNIAIRSSGAYPVRPGDGRGDVIRDGSLSANDWVGRLPVDKYPSSLNPPQGFLASANQQPVDPAQNTAYMGSDWYSPWRAMRINALLAADSQLTPDKMRILQTDPGSARADAFIPQLVAAARREDSAGRGDQALREAARILEQWDRRYTRGNHTAVLFEATMRELGRRTWDELSDAKAPQADTYLLPEEQTLLELLSFPESIWWDDRRTPAREGRDAIVGASLRKAFTTLRAEKGPPQSSGWLWSNTRHANIRHLLQIPAFSALKIPVQGGPSTISPSSGKGTQGASWRMVVELGREVRAWAVYPGGQSGAPASSRYTNRLSRWAMGQLEPVQFPRKPEDLPRSHVISTLVLRPQ